MSGPSFSQATILQLTLLSLALCLNPTSTWACGGCFAPPSLEVSEVTGHRMAFSISDARTVLWDQFEYSGEPEDFSWVLPVRAGAYVEIGSPDFLESLDAVTATRVAAPPFSCPSSSQGCGCPIGMMSASDESASSQVDDGSRVTVVSRETVGPYETVILRSEDPTALQDWLASNGYVIPSDIDPIITAYVEEGYDFLALRLSPGLGIQQMQPVRVVTPEGEPVLPLRMVAAGVGANVAITLFVIGEQRYGMPDLVEQVIDEKDLVWNFNTSESNIDELRQEAFDEMLGFAYIVSFANRNVMNGTLNGPGGQTAYFYKPSDSRSYQTFANLYFGDSGSQCNTALSALTGTNYVVDCEPGDCLASQIPATNLTCRNKDDISAALIGMRPATAWLMRFDMNLPRRALDHDCTLVPSPSVTTVSPWLQAEQQQGDPGPGAVAYPSSRNQPLGPWALTVMSLTAATYLARRLARRTLRNDLAHSA